MNDERKRNCIKTVLFVLLAAIVLFPLAYLCGNALMSPSEIGKYYEAVRPDYDGEAGTALHLIPDKVSFESFNAVFLSRPDYLLKFWKSLLSGIVAAGGQCIVSCMAGFAFAKYEFAGKKPLFAALVVLMLLPVQVTLVPQYMVLDRFHLLDTWAAIVLPPIFSPFGTLWMRYVFQKLPDAPLQAARLDGATTSGVLFRLAVPMSRGAVSCLFALSFIDAWNMVEQPMTFLKNQWQYPLSVFLSVVNDTNFSLSFAGGVLALIPVFLLFLLSGRNLAEGFDFMEQEDDMPLRRTRAAKFTAAVLLMLAVCTGASFVAEQKNLTEVSAVQPAPQTLSDGREYSSVVPSGCIFSAPDGRNAIFVLEQSDGLFGPRTVVRQRIVTVLARDGGQAAVSGAYSAGTRLACSADAVLQDGQIVRIQ